MCDIEVMLKNEIWSICMCAMKQSAKRYVCHPNICDRRCIGFTYLSIPVIFQHHEDTWGIHKHKKRCSYDLEKSLNAARVLVSSQSNFSTGIFLCKELTSSGIWQRPGKTYAVARTNVFFPFFLYAFKPIDTHPHTPLTWILVLPGLTTCW